MSIASWTAWFRVEGLADRGLQGRGASERKAVRLQGEVGLKRLCLAGAMLETHGCN